MGGYGLEFIDPFDSVTGELLPLLKPQPPLFPARHWAPGTESESSRIETIDRGRPLDTGPRRLPQLFVARGTKMLSYLTQG